MSKKLHSRPDLDHLRKQAKALLCALNAGDTAAAKTFREHLPLAKGMSDAKLREAGLRLADAQSAIARQSGFDAWPMLARHVEQLRALEGTWEFERLEVGGSSVPAAMMAHSRILIDGDKFRTESPEAIYEGVFNIDVEAEPHAIDIDFVAGPEAGRRNSGIFRMVGKGDQLEICLDMSGGGRPAAFTTKGQSSHACELLKRASSERPKSVTGGEVSAATSASLGGSVDPSAFAMMPSVTLERLQGEWGATRLTIDGKDMPAMILKTARRVARDNTLKVTVGGQVVVDALVRIDERTTPMNVDYLCAGGAGKGAVQLGIMAWRGDEILVAMGRPGGERPGDFECPAGSGRTVSQWKRISL